MAQITDLATLRQHFAEPNPLTSLKIRDHLDAQAIAFVGRSPFALLATTAPDGGLEVSPKGDEPGFVAVEDAKTLLLPERDGNNLIFSLTNILERPDVGLLFLLPGTGEMLRVSGTATLHDDAALCQRLVSRGKPAKLVTRIAVTRAYFHCARAILRASLWKPEGWPEPLKVSFGRVIAEATAAQAGSETIEADQIDAFVAEGYRTGV